MIISRCPSAGELLLSCNVYLCSEVATVVPLKVLSQVDLPTRRAEMREVQFVDRGGGRGQGGGSAGGSGVVASLAMTSCKLAQIGSRR